MVLFKQTSAILKKVSDLLQTPTVDQSYVREET
jgi:hypothetical protein